MTSLADYWTVPDAEKSLPRPLRLELTALYYDPGWKLLWGSDGTQDTFLALENVSPRLRSGQRFILSGSYVPARGLPLRTAKLTILPDAPPPIPLPTAGQFTDSARFNGHLVTAEGYVNAQTDVDAAHLQLDLAIEGASASARLLLADSSPVPQLQGALVRLAGVYVADDGPGGRVNLWIPSATHVEFLGWLDRDPRFERPATPIDQLSATTPLARVVGTVESQQPGGQLVLRDSTGQVTVFSAMTLPVAPGSRVEALGRPDSSGLVVSLRAALYRPVAAGAPAAETEPTRGLPRLRLVAQIRALDRAAADLGYPVRLRAAVTWSHPASRTIYVIDSSGGLAVALPPGTGDPPAPGSRLDLVGHTHSGSFAPALVADRLEAVDGINLPSARAVTLEQALTGIEESQWISLSGYVRSIVPQPPWQRLTVTTSAGEFTAVLPDTIAAQHLPGAVVQLRGVSRAVTDEQHQLTGIELWCASPDDIRIEEPKPTAPFATPLRTIGGLRQFNAFDAFNRRVRVTGLVVHHQPGAFLNLQDGRQSLLVLSRDTTALRPGDRVEAVGFPGRQGQRIVLRESIYRVIAHEAEPSPVALDRPEILHPPLDGQIVRLEATIADLSRRATAVHLICQAAGTAFEAIASPGESPGLESLRLGSRVAITGVYLLQYDQNSQPRAFELQLRSARDIAVLEAPSWWTAARTRAVVGGLLAAVFLGISWAVLLRRRVARQTAEIRDHLEKSARLEAELLRSTKLDSLGVLAGGIAHDFNNLLTVVLGNLSLVLSDGRTSADDEHCLRESERAALRARDLTQQLLTFAKGGDPVRSAVALPDIVREAAGFALHGSRVRCDFDFAAGLWAAHVDRGQISQVVHNIVINALQAMPTGGVVSISLRNATVTAADALPLPSGNYLRLDLADTGGGIRPDHLARIFDPYFTTKQQGSGLGLATVHSIVRKHAGHISVDSELGRGTTFHIWLPAAAGLPDSSPASRRAPRQLHGLVLFMDDEATVRDLGTAMLRRLGLEVTAVADGAETLRVFRAAREAGRPFDLVILDLTVPGGMGGKEAAAELRLLDPEVRLIVSSGYSNDPIVAQYQAHGFQGRIPKPYVYDQFAAVLAAALPPPAA